MALLTDGAPALGGAEDDRQGSLDGPGALRAVEDLDDRRVPPTPRRLPAHDIDAGLVRQGVAVGSLGRQRVVDIDDREDADQERNLISRQAVRIARPVELLVMVTDQRNELLHRPQLSAELGAEDRMA